MVFAPNKVGLGSLGQGFAKWKKNVSFNISMDDIKRALRKKKRHGHIFYSQQRLKQTFKGEALFSFLTASS